MENQGRLNVPRLHVGDSTLGANRSKAPVTDTAKGVEFCFRHLDDSKALHPRALCRQLADDQRLSPHVCLWYRNEVSVGNEGYQYCWTGSTFHRFWPVEQATVGSAAPLLVREIVADRLSPAETRVITYLYL